MGGKFTIFVTTILLAAGMGLGWYFSSYKHFQDQIKQKEEEIQSINDQLEANKDIEDKISRQKEEKKKLVQQIENLRKWFGTREHIPEVLKVMELTSKKYGVKMKDIKFSPLIEYDGYSELPIEISFEGRYHKYGEFLAFIENRRIVNINGAVINITPRGNPQYNKETSKFDILSLNISVSVKAYILHDQGGTGG